MAASDLNKLRAQGIAMLDQYWLELAEHQREILRIAMYGPELDEIDTNLIRMMGMVCITEILTRQNTKQLNGQNDSTT